MELELIVNMVTPTVLMVLGFFLSRARTPAREWFQANADNQWVRLGYSVIQTLVDQAEMTFGENLEDSTGARKKAAVSASAMTALLPNKAKIERATGMPLNSFVDAAIESSVLQKDMKAASANAATIVSQLDPTSAE